MVPIFIASAVVGVVIEVANIAVNGPPEPSPKTRRAPRGQGALRQLMLAYLLFGRRRGSL